MSKLTITDAAKAWRKSRQTIYNYTQDGRLSTEQDEQGRTTIDTAEMSRVFGEPANKPPKKQQAKQVSSELRHQLEIEQVKRGSVETRALDLEQRVRSLEGQIERLQLQHEKALSTFGDSLKLLAAPQERERKPSFFRWLVGNNKTD